MPTTFGTPAYGAAGVIAAPHYLAASAGLDVLRDGGSAVDAAIAANLVMGVIWPQMCGPGGDLFAQVWSAAEQRLYGLNASGRAGQGMSGDAYRAQGLTSMPQQGPLAITVPGAVDGWFTLHARFGRVPFERVAQRRDPPRADRLPGHALYQRRDPRERQSARPLRQRRGGVPARRSRPRARRSPGPARAGRARCTRSSSKAPTCSTVVHSALASSRSCKPTAVAWKPPTSRRSGANG